VDGSQLGPRIFADRKFVECLLFATSSLLAREIGLSTKFHWGFAVNPDESLKTFADPLINWNTLGLSLTQHTYGTCYAYCLQAAASRSRRLWALAPSFVQIS